MEKAPKIFVCCLTLEVMNHPVQHKVSKHNFERSAIMEWIYFGKATCPLTREKLHPGDFADNEELKHEIMEWKIANNILDESSKMDDSSISIRVIRKMPTRRPVTQRQGSVKNLMSLRDKILGRRDEKVRNHARRRQSTGGLCS